MALEKGRMRDVPEDAMILTEEHALKYQSRILNNWNVPSDIAGYKYSSLILGATTSLTAIYLNTFYRRTFKLLNHAKITSYIPVATIPGFMSILLHRQFVMNDIILQKGTCPVCLEVRGGAIQLATGLLMPLLITPISCLSLVHRFYTYDAPYISKEPLKLISLVAVKTKPIKNALFWIMIGHAILGNGVTYLEMDSIWRVNQKLTLLGQVETQS